MASKPCQPGSEEVLTAEQLQSKKYKSFLFQDGEKVFSLKSVLKSFSLTKKKKKKKKKIKKNKKKKKKKIKKKHKKKKGRG